MRTLLRSRDIWILPLGKNVIAIVAFPMLKEGVN